MPLRKPCVGDDVHCYPNRNDGKERDLTTQPNAAKITRVNDDGSVNLWIFPTGLTTSRAGNAMNVPFGDPVLNCRDMLWCWRPGEAGVLGASGPAEVGGTLEAGSGVPGGPGAADGEDLAAVQPLNVTAPDRHST